MITSNVVKLRKREKERENGRRGERRERENVEREKSPKRDAQRPMTSDERKKSLGERERRHSYGVSSPGEHEPRRGVTCQS